MSGILIYFSKNMGMSKEKKFKRETAEKEPPKEIDLNDYWGNP